MSELLDALVAKYNGDVMSARANISVFQKNPAGIGEHTAEHFLNEGKKALHKLGEAEDLLETIERHFGH